MLRRQKLIGLTAAGILTLLTLAPAGIAAAATRPLSPATYPSVPGRFYSVSAASANDVWAVGLSAAGGQISHWNGKSWTEYQFSTGFQDVSAQSATDVWAVGGTAWFYPTQTLAYHWNGKTWSQVPTPTPGGSAWFNDVAATSPTNAWAVGSIGGGPGALGYAIPLIEHWNGKTWKQQTFPLPIHSGQFMSVAATSARNAWAVGWTGNRGPNGALIEHWNGKRWRRVWPGTANGRGDLQGVTATGPDDIWAAGYNNDGPTYQSLILHYNGKRWSPVASPNPTGSTDLWGVSASSRTNAWAVGYTNPNGCYCGTAAFHWNGKSWSTVATPNPSAGFLDALLGVVAVSPSDAWAVGSTDWSSTLIEHWNGKSWQD